MPPRIRVEVNAAALRAFVRQMPQTREGVQAVADDIAAVARAHAPVGHDARQGHEPGTLRDSITTRRVMSKGQEGDTVRVEAGVFYAAFVELGTRNMAAEPFLRPAAARYRQNRAGHYATVQRRKARRRASTTA